MRMDLRKIFNLFNAVANIDILSEEYHSQAMQYSYLCLQALTSLKIPFSVLFWI
jgi:hypothetical protein